MPSTPEEKKNAWKFVLKQIKMYAVAVTAAGASVWGIAEVYLEDYVRSTAKEVIEEKSGKKSFREILGEQMDIPSDVVPYHLTQKIAALDSLIKDIQDFEEKYIPHLEHQMSITPMYRFLDDEGVEWWSGPDGRAHGVVYTDGDAWCVYHGNKQDLCDCR